MAQSHFTLVRLLRHIFFRLNTRFHRIQNFLQKALSFGSVFSDLSCGLTPNATSVYVGGHLCLLVVLVCQRPSSVGRFQPLAFSSL